MNSTHIVRRRGKFLAPSAGRGLASRLKGNCDAYYVVRAQVLGVFPPGEPRLCLDQNQAECEDKQYMNSHESTWVWGTYDSTIASSLPVTGGTRAGRPGSDEARQVGVPGNSH